jgi:hypothetical protein
MATSSSPRGRSGLHGHERGEALDLVRDHGARAAQAHLEPRAAGRLEAVAGREERGARPGEVGEGLGG